MTNRTQFPVEISAIAQRLGLSPDTVYYCLEVELVGQSLAEPDLAELRRVRRLLDLEVNLAGVEIILRMRRQMQTMQAHLERMSAEMTETRKRFESQIREIEQRLAQDL